MDLNNCHKSVKVNNDDQFCELLYNLTLSDPTFEHYLIIIHRILKII